MSITRPFSMHLRGHYRDRQGRVWQVVNAAVADGVKGALFLAVCLQPDETVRYSEWFFADGRWSVMAKTPIDLIEAA